MSLMYGFAGFKLPCLLKKTLFLIRTEQFILFVFVINVTDKNKISIHTGHFGIVRTISTS